MGGARIFAVWGQRGGTAKGIGAETGHMTSASSYLGATEEQLDGRAEGTGAPAAPTPTLSR